MMTFLMTFFLTVSSFASEDSLENGFAGTSAIFFLASYYNVAIRTTGLLFLWPSGEDAGHGRPEGVETGICPWKLGLRTNYF